MSGSDVLTLRDRLRAQTLDVHEALDCRVSAYDFASRDGIIRFLRMQTIALGRLDGETLGLPLLRMIADLRARALDDLASAGRADVGRPDRQAFHPAACDYVLSGSRLGDQILRRRWALHARSTGIGGAFFGAPSYAEMWQAFCIGRGSQAGAGPEADRIADDSVALFGLFHEAATEAESGEDCLIHG